MSHGSGTQFMKSDHNKLSGQARRLLSALPNCSLAFSEPRDPTHGFTHGGGKGGWG